MNHGFQADSSSPDPNSPNDTILPSGSFSQPLSCCRSSSIGLLRCASPVLLAASFAASALQRSAIWRQRGAVWIKMGALNAETHAANKGHAIPLQSPRTNRIHFLNLSCAASSLQFFQLIFVLPFKKTDLLDVVCCLDIEPRSAIPTRTIHELTEAQFDILKQTFKVTMFR